MSAHRNKKNPTLKQRENKNKTEELMEQQCTIDACSETFNSMYGSDWLP
jgi:hypothetical protein